MTATEPPAAVDADPVSVVSRIYAARGDQATLFELLDPAIVITQDERLPWGGRFVGHDGFRTFGATLTGIIESAVTTDALFEADGTVVQAGRTRGTVRATGQPFDVAEVHRWVVQGGRAVEAHFSIDTPAMLAALAAPAPSG